MIELKSLDELTPQQIHQLFKLRVDVFVVEQQCPYSEIDDQDADPDTRHILAWDADGRLAGCARVFPTPSSETGGARFGRFIVNPAFRGTGVGPEILRAGMDYTERFPGDLIVEAQVGLVDYYSRFGFMAEGDEFDDAGIMHRRMRLRR